MIYGLGNPGKKYEYTRHNIGFLVVDLLSGEWGIPTRSSSNDLVWGKGQVFNVPVMLAKPQTYMNLSGAPLRYLKIQAEDLIVIHDDMDLPAGDVRVKTGGGTGGHKGLESIVEALSSGDFLRIRCGIGRPVGSCDPRDHVLGLFDRDDLPAIKAQIDKAASAVETCLKEGPVKAMNLFNRREREP